jgi:hypothetical protein
MATEFIIIFIAVVAVLLAIIMAKRAKRNNPSKTVEEEQSIYSIAVNQSETLANELTISDVESLIIKGRGGSELVLTRPDTMRLAERKYREICVRGASIMAQAVQGAMPVLTKAQTLSAIAKAAPNGLFTATARIGELMKYTADGTVSSIVKKNGKIVAHSGFTEVTLQGIANPAAIFSAGVLGMAAISAQYYMHEISAQLKNVDHKLDKLIGYHHDEKIGILKNINHELHAIINKNNVDVADIISCQNMEKECGKVFFEYNTRLEGVNVEAKERWFNKTRELTELGDNIDENELDFSIEMCYRSSELREKCKLAEIAVRMKIGRGQEGFISEQVENLQRLSSSETFHRCPRQYIDNYYAPIIAKADEILEVEARYSENVVGKARRLIYGVPDKENNIQLRKEKIIEKLTGENNANLVEKLGESKEMLVLLGETSDTPRIFMLDDDDDDDDDV